MKEEKKNNGSEYTEELNLMLPVGYKIKKRKRENIINFFPEKIVKEGVLKMLFKKIFRIG